MTLSENERLVWQVFSALVLLGPKGAVANGERAKIVVMRFFVKGMYGYA